MVLHCSRRDVLYAGTVAFGLGAAGCIGARPDGGEPRGSRREQTTARGQPTPSTRSPTSTPAVSDETAEDRALVAEEAYIEEGLRNAPCVSNWGTSGTTSSSEARVVERTPEVVRVEVTHPYWYSTIDREADLSSDAVYVITTDGTTRVSGDYVYVAC